MELLLFALGVLLASGAVALLVPHRRWSSRLGAAGAVAGCAIGLVPALRVLGGAPAAALRAAWQVPYGAFAVEIDALSAFFLVPILGLSALAAVYGAEYLGAGEAKRPLGPAWFFFNLLVASMALVVVARNAILFLVAWELMALASFFLVTFDDDQPGVEDAGWTYLVATHLGTACLLALFILLGRAHANLDFDVLGGGAAPAGILFLLAVVGFGAKAGFLPLHVWLPEAHPAAPSHVSAVMSGVMIKTGVYGLLRIVPLLGPPPAWWGWTLCTIGVASGLLGLLFALAQHDLKRGLAYSSVENVGIIAVGLGIGEVGLAIGSASLAVLGFAGALLHVWNHAVMKGLLFLGVGAVAHATGTRQIDQLGGVLRRMPWTGAACGVGALALAGLPPLSGFVSELVLLLGALTGVARGEPRIAAGLLGVIAALALIAGLATACFTRLFGIAFLGEPRSARVGQAREPGPAMRVPVLLLAASCPVVAPLAMAGLGPVVERVSGLSAAAASAGMTSASTAVRYAVAGGLALLLLVALLAALRFGLLARRGAAAGGTWDCGYARPTARMQYTGSSFAQPLTDLFAPVLRSRRRLVLPAGLFPGHAALSTDTPDVCTRGLYAPLFGVIGRGLSALRWLQHGRVHLYVLYIALTLLVLLVWTLG